MTLLTKLENILGQFGAKLKNHLNLSFVAFGLLLSLLALFPHIDLIKFGTMSVFAYIMIYAVTAMGLNILLGFSGLISLGTAGFMGAGALGTAVFIDLGVPFEIAAILVLIITGLFGALIGLFSLKVEGIYLAIATLFVGEILRQIFTQVAIFGGQSKTLGPEGLKLLGFIEISQIFQGQRSVLFILLVVIMVIMMIVMNNIVRSKTGRALLAMSRSEHAAQAMGISLMKYRLTAFILATLFATVGGIMYAMFFQTVPTTRWTLDTSLFIIAMVVVGGFKSIYGSFLGAFIIHGVPNLILKNLFGDISYIFSGLLIILVIIFYPHGFVYIWTDIKKGYYKLRYKQKKDVATDE